MTRSASKIVRRLALATWLALAAACGRDNPTAPDGTRTTPATAQEFTGNNQRGTVGTTLGAPFVVEVLDAEGRAVGGATVAFAVSAGGGVVSPAEAVTNASGQARTTLTLGSTAGANTVTATVRGLRPVTFTAVGVAGAAAQLVVASGAGQRGTVAAALADPVVVRLVDAAGNGVAGVPLAATTAAGSGTLTFEQPITNAAGEATAVWRLGTRVGAHRATLSAPSLSTIPELALAATAVAGAPDSVVAVSGNGQTGDGADVLPTHLGVRVADAHGNPVAGQSVAFAVTGGGGSVSPAQALTDSAGRAATTLTLGASGTQSVTATVSSAALTRTALFTATAVAPSPGTFVALAHRVLDAEYDASTNTIVTISASPARLHVIDPEARTVHSVDLPVTPIAVSVAPAGGHAAVSHDAFVSYVNLATRTVERTYPTSTVGGDVVLGGNGYVYVFPRSDQWVDVHSIALATGVETRTFGPYANARAKRHPSGESIYAASNGLSPSDFEKYDIRSGTARSLYDSPYHGDYSFAGDLWIAGDGTRLFARSGNVFRASASRTEDMTFAGALSGVSTVTGAVQHAGSPRIYVLGVTASGDPWSPTPLGATAVRSYDAAFLAFKGSVRLPKVRVAAGDGAVVSVDGEGFHLFQHAASPILYVLMRAPASAGLANDWGVARFSTADLP